MRDEQERANDNKEFGNSVDKKTELFELIKETLIKTAEKEFEEQGFKPVEGAAGMYGDEATYGAGAKPEEFSIKISGKTLPSIERTLQLGGKRLTSEVKCVLQNGRLKINYNTPENTGLKNMIVRKEISLSTSLTNQKIKKQLEELFSDAAILEVAYLQSASLGVETGSQNYYNPNKPTMEIINNTMTIKEIFTSESSSTTDFTQIPEDEKNINKVVDKNTIDLGDGKTMFLDREAVEEISNKLKSGDKSYNKFFKETLNKFDCKSLGEVKTKGSEEEFLKELASYTVSEITAVGGGAASGVGGGAGAYLTPVAFKKPGSSNQSLKGPFVQIAPEASTQKGESLKESVNLTKDLKDTPYYKSSQKKPKVDKDWNILSEKAGDPYNISVKVDPNTHAMGLPFLKPNSKEEEVANAIGDPGKLKRIGVKKLNEVVQKVDKKLVSETEAERVQRLGKKKFSSIVENETLGVNKRYIITEKTTKEYEKERMGKLAGFKLYESIHDAENLSEVLGAEPVVGTVPCEITNDSTDSTDFLQTQDEFEGEGENNVPEDFELNAVNTINEEVVEVQKPGSLFGLTYKFKKADYLNENKRYLLDMNSMVFVLNPNLIK